MASNHPELQRIAAALRLSEERLSVVLEGTGNALWEWDIASDDVRWSPNLGPMYGLQRGESPASYEAYSELVHPDDRDGLAADVAKAVSEGRGYEREYRALWPDGRTLRWLHSRAHVLPGDDGRPQAVLGVITDITDRKRRERASEFLAQAGAVLAQSLEESATLERIAQLAVPELADWCSVHLADENGVLRQVAVAHQDPARVELARRLSERYPPLPGAPTGVPAVVRTGRSELYPELSDEVLVASGRDAEHLQLIRDLQLRSVMIVPVSARGQTVGAITFVYAESGLEYDSTDLALAEELGRRAGLAIANVRLYENAQNTAITLQRSLLQDSLPCLDGLEAAATYLPGAAGAEIGGDWYDVMQLPDGRAAVMVGDVMGRGLRAAALMGQLRTALRTYASVAEDPCEAVALLRRYVSSQRVVDFATLLVLYIDPETGRTLACSAGHPPPIVASSGAAEFVAMTPGPPLGSLPGDSALTELELGPGQTVLLYTDGLVERRSEPIDHSLGSLLTAVANGPAAPGPLIDHVVDVMLPGGTHHDDVAVLAVRRS
jgi:PAS domain S-box-containing protein